MSYFFYALIAFLLFRFITGFIWPVYKATKAAKKQFEQMRTHAQNNRSSEEEKPFHKNTPYEEKPKFDIGGEYIPYEEVKEK
jgi:hypothetical protein